jgi:hypothetical protein
MVKSKLIGLDYSFVRSPKRNRVPSSVPTYVVRLPGGLATYSASATYCAGINCDEGLSSEVVSADHETATRSRSSGQPKAFGWTATGKYITVVFEYVTDDPLTVYPITAYEVPPPT